MTLGKRIVVLVAALLSATALTGPAPARAAAPTPASGTTSAPSSYVHRSRVIGHSAQGRPIRAFYIGWTDATRVLVFCGQMHGDEHAGIRTADWIRQHVHPTRGNGIWVVRTMNPDGNARNTRKNARGVDLNRNWPTSGWHRERRGDRYYGGPRAASEPEVRAMMRFLAEVKPDKIASIHQPLDGIGTGGGAKAWLQRLHRALGLRIQPFGVGNPAGTVSPTMTGWYNKHYRKYGVATTIEYPARPSAHFVTVRAGRGIPRAARVLLPYRP